MDGSKKGKKTAAKRDSQVVNSGRAEITVPILNPAESNQHQPASLMYGGQKTLLNNSRTTK